jgi:hypothetical protein
LRGAEQSSAGGIVVIIPKETWPLISTGSTVAEQSSRLIRIQISEKTGAGVVVSSEQRSTLLWLILLLIGIAEETGSRRLALCITEKSRTGICTAATKKGFLCHAAISSKQIGGLTRAATAKETALRLCAAVASKQSGTDVCRTGASEQSSGWLRLCGICAERTTEKRLLLILSLVLAKDTRSLSLGVVSKKIATARAAKRIRVRSCTGVGAEPKSRGGV